MSKIHLVINEKCYKPYGWLAKDEGFKNIVAISEKTAILCHNQDKIGYSQQFSGNYSPKLIKVYFANNPELLMWVLENQWDIKHSKIVDLIIKIKQTISTKLTIFFNKNKNNKNKKKNKS